MKGDWCNASGLLRQNVTDKMSAAINATGHPLWWVHGPCWVAHVIRGSRRLRPRLDGFMCRFNFHCDGEYAEWCPQDGVSSRVDHDHQAGDCERKNVGKRLGYVLSLYLQDYWDRPGYGTKEIINDAMNISAYAGAQGAATGGGYWWP